MPYICITGITNSVKCKITLFTNHTMMFLTGLAIRRANLTKLIIKIELETYLTSA
jgi:hypothetical protein